MSIIRAKRPDTNYYILDRKISEDKRIGWAARGLLVYLLGKPDHWTVSVAALVNETSEANTKSGRDAVYKLLNELIEAGYITRKQNNDGRFGNVDYVVSETPQKEVPHTAKPHTAKPHTESTYTANPTLVINELKESNELSNTPCSPPEGDQPQAEGKKKREYPSITLKTFIEKCESKGEDAIPQDSAVFKNAQDAGLPIEFVAIAWMWLKDKYIHGKDKNHKQSNWRNYFREAVNGAWGGLWRYDVAADQYVLTSAGHQYKKRMQAQEGEA